MKKLAFLIFFVLGLTLNVLAVGQVDIINIATVAANPGSTATFKIDIQNTGRETTIQTITFTSTVLTGPTTLPAPTITQLTNLTAGTAQQKTFTILVPEGTPAGTYLGMVKAIEQGNATNGDTQQYNLTVNSQLAVSFTPTDLKMFGEPGESVEETIIIKNIGNVVLTDIVLNHTLGTLKDDKDRKIQFTMTPSTLTTLAVGASQSVLLRADVENGFEKKTYTGTFKLVSAQGQATVPFTLGVKPVACKAGKKGRLSVDIKKPDEDDKFRAGDIIPVEIQVKNDGAAEARVIVEAVLYNEDKDKIVDQYRTDSRRIDKNDDYTYKFSLELDSRIREDDTYKIYVKAYERSKEELNCNDAEDVSIDVEELRDFTQIDSFSLSPVTAKCGEEVFGSVRLINKGTKRANIKVTIKNQELGLNENLPSFTLDGDGRNNFDKILSFSFKIPEKAQQKIYKIQTLVEYNGISTSAEKTISVKDCEQEKQGVPSGAKVSGAAVGQAQEKPQDTTVVFTEQGLLDRFSKGIPTSFWILANIVLALLIILLLVIIMRRSKTY